ncbi:MAG: hypothetical protein Q6353_015640 [Candidatus Sigynarchaeum springense]
MMVLNASRMFDFPLSFAPWIAENPLSNFICPVFIAPTFLKPRSRMCLMNTMVDDRDCRVLLDEYDLDIPGGILRPYIICIFGFSG